MHWYLVGRTDSRARALADRHYSRKKPGYTEFCPPGHNIVLIIPSDTGATALWCSHRSDPTVKLDQPRRDNFQCWDNPYFRNESGVQSSLLIQEALAVTRFLWGTDHLPADGFHSFVDPKRVKPIKRRNNWFYGYCFHKAGFQAWPVLTERNKLIRYVLPLEKLLTIPPAAPHYEQLQLFA